MHWEEVDRKRSEEQVTMRRDKLVKTGEEKVRGRKLRSERRWRARRNGEACWLRF